jgi:hypothetical protein
MIEIFKTNVESLTQAESLLTLLQNQFVYVEMNFDLDDCDKILRVKGERFCPLSIAGLLADFGFECQLLD